MALPLAAEMWMQQIEAEERGRLDRWAKAWELYFGNHPRPLKVKSGQADDNVILNYARVIVDKGVTYLFGKEPAFDLDESTERSPAEQWLDECWRVNKKMLLLQKVATNGGVCGHAFIKVQLPTVAKGYPRLINISPEYVTVVTDPDDMSIIWRYRVQYPAVGLRGESLVIRQVIERNESGRWTVLDQVSVNDGQWQTRQQMIWPYDWPPMIDTQNLPSANEYYGRADIEPDVLGINAAVNFVVSNWQRIIRYHAHPKSIIKGATAAEVRADVDATLVLPNPQADAFNLEMTSDLSGAIELYNRLREALHETARIPEVATGKVDNIGQLSGLALQILYGPLVELTEQKRLTYGDLLVELNRRLLETAGFGTDQIVTVRWPEILPRDPMQEAALATTKQQIGVSKDTLLTELGYDPEEERQKREADRAESAEIAEAAMARFDRGE